MMGREEWPDSPAKEGVGSALAGEKGKWKLRDGQERWCAQESLDVPQHTQTQHTSTTQNSPVSSPWGQEGMLCTIPSHGRPASAPSLCSQPLPRSQQPPLRAINSVSMGSYSPLSRL